MEVKKQRSYTGDDASKTLVYVAQTELMHRPDTAHILPLKNWELLRPCEITETWLSIEAGRGMIYALEGLVPNSLLKQSLTAVKDMWNETVEK